MARKSRRVWRSWLSSGAAVLAAGVLAGWLFRDDEPAFSAQEPPKENRLAKESSPYLLLHKHNPVDWFPWGAEAFEKAQREGKPVFLSIGYSSCYWCHVMERESFSNVEIAKTLNENFVCIKVDREELPHVDEVYMNAVHAMGMRGGWPLSVFLTADRKPFFGGTYFPPTDRGEMPGFPRVLERVLAAWHTEREAVNSTADLVLRAIQQAPRSFGTRTLDRQLVATTVSQLATQFDPEYGGFGFDPRRDQRPKFPQPSNLSLLLYHARQARDQNSLSMLSLTLDRLARGGIWDHVGGGFHRYSVDRFWRVPHFEKMLYDNAQMASVYLEAFEWVKNPLYRYQAEGIFQFVARELTAPDGGFYSALDAESEHEEGKFYVWTEQEVKEVLGAKDFALFATAYGLDAPPNFERNYVLQRNLPSGELAKRTKLTVMELERSLIPLRQKLLVARDKRPKPLLDTKILTDWNGLMIAALADGYRILGNEAHRTAAERAADFLLTRSRDKDGRLLHTNTAGQAKLAANLDDHAFLIHGLLALHRATNNPRWLNAARSLGDQMVTFFWDESAGGFFLTATDQDIVLVRLKSPRDSVVPSGNSAAVRALTGLAVATGDDRYATLAGKTLAAYAGELTTSPTGQPHMVRGLAEFIDAGFQATGIVQQPTGEGEKVRASAVLSVDRLQPGREFQVAVDLEIDRGWHIYGNPSSPPFLLPTTLKVTSEMPLDAVKVNYPRGIPMTIEGSTEPVAGYGDTARIRARARLGEKAEIGKGTIRLALQFQACDNRRCLAPQRIVIDLPVEVVAASETVSPQFSEIFDAKSPSN